MNINFGTEYVNSTNDLLNITTVSDMQNSFQATPSHRASQRKLRQEARIMFAAENNPEQAILERECNKIKAQVNAYFSGMGAYHSSARINAIKDEITDYLLSVGSSAAKQLLKEFQQNGWKNL